jgi:peptidyl-prolyl cis-trans isomerase SurA
MITDVRIPVARLLRAALLGLSVAGLVAACQSKPASTPAWTDVWAVVDGHSITRDAVEKAYRGEQRTEPLPEEDAFTAKMALLDDLIDQEVFLAKAGQLKIDVPAADLDKAYTEGRKNITEDAFKQELARRGLTEADVRERLRREMVVQKLFEREVSSKVSVTDQEISAFYEANKAQFNRNEEAYHVAQIAITPGKDDRIANRTGSDAASTLEAVKKYRMVMDKLKAGAQFSEVAADYSEDPDSAPRGGDLGFIPRSVVQKYPPQLRDAVLNATPGSAKAVGDDRGFFIVLVLGKDAAGQKDLGTPGVKEAIGQTLKSRREQLLRSAYTSVLRNSATIENRAATRVVQAQGKVQAIGQAGR